VSVQAARDLLITRSQMVRSLLTIYVQPVRHEIDPLTMAQALHDLVTNLVLELRLQKTNKISRICQALTLILRQAAFLVNLLFDTITERTRGKAQLAHMFRQALSETFEYTVSGDLAWPMID
jgi:hypothetical protein